MKLIFLGTGGYHPNDRRETSCMMIPELGIVLDAGSGMYRVARHLETDKLNIFVTHAHLDHVIGITFLFNIVGDRKMEYVRIHGAAEKLAAIDEHLFAPPLFPVKPPMEFCPLADSLELPGGGRLTHFPLEHPGGSTGYRLDWPDRSMAYVTDTTAAPDASYVSHIRGVDLLVHECYFPDGREDFAKQTGHSCLTPVAQVAQQANVGRLVLTHVDPLDESDSPIDLSSARRQMKNTELAEDGMAVDF